MQQRNHMRLERERRKRLDRSRAARPQSYSNGAVIKEQVRAVKMRMRRQRRADVDPVREADLPAGPRCSAACRRHHPSPLRCCFFQMLITYRRRHATSSSSLAPPAECRHPNTARQHIIITPFHAFSATLSLRHAAAIENIPSRRYFTRPAERLMPRAPPRRRRDAETRAAG